MLAQDDAIGGHADRFRGHDLIAERIAEHAVLVNAGFMGEGIASDDGLVGLHVEAEGAGEHLAGGVDLGAVDAAEIGIDVGADMDAHDHLFEGGSFRRARRCR